MDLHDPESSAPSPSTDEMTAASPDEAGTEVDGEESRLLDLMGRWHERYLRGEDPTPEELGVVAAAVGESLRERILDQKRLFSLLGYPDPISFAETPDLDGSSPLVVDREIEARDRSQSGRRIGRYLVVEALGEGGQGEVFRVVHPELGRAFVLKLARRAIAADPAGRERMLREGRLLAGFDHPNLVRVVDIDFHEGRPFAVMEHVQGLNLQQYAEKHALGPREAARILVELARCVAYFHARGILHLDIKPRNVLIDEDGRPRLIDFGLARLRDAWVEDPKGSSGGTTGYMSPEQANGQGGQIGPWTDVFGLGGVLYYLLTGRPVYQGTSAFAAIQRASKGEQVSPRSINPRVPRALERICLKALAPDSERRYRTATELERALRHLRWKPRAVAVGAAALACLASLAFALVWRRSDATTLTSARPLEASAILSAAAPEGRLHITSFEIRHFRGDDPPESLGTIVSLTEPFRFDDDVRVHARINIQSYFYLIALNADGKIQLCSPATPTEPPPRSDAINAPPGGLYFPLKDGVGLQAFVLLASREPLPPYDDWKGKSGLHWEAIPADGERAWAFDGDSFEPLDVGRRGPPREHSGEPGPFKRLCHYVATQPGVDAVKAVAFAVLPRE